MNQELLNKAIAHITDQANEVTGDDGLALMLSEHLMEMCTNLTVANALLSPEKSLKEISDKIWDKAKSQRGGKNRIFISDKDCCDMAEEYYGISANSLSSTGSKAGTVIDVTELL